MLSRLWRNAWPAAGWLPLLLCGVASGDTFLFEGGGRLEGTLLNPDESPRKEFVVRTERGVLLRLPADKVAEHRPASPELVEYEQLLAAMAHSVEDHLRVANFCYQAGLREEREFHLQQVIALDSDHAEARAGLGYSTVNGKWVLADEFQRSRGKIRHEGEWKLPQEIALGEAVEARQATERDWKQQAARWRRALRGRRAAEAVAELNAVAAPQAAAALEEWLDDEEHAEVRLVLVRVLGRLRSGVASDALTEAAVNDDVEEIRDAAVMELVRDPFRRQRAVQGFIAALKEKDNRLVQRAAKGLARLADPVAIPALIDALITTHKITLPGRGGNIGATFGRGGSGLNAGGGGPRVVERRVENTEVLIALQATVGEGVNFHFDQARWRQWFADRHTPAEIDFRRDD